MSKCPSKNPDPPVQNNFYTSENSEGENGEINFPIIFIEVREKKSNTTFSEELFEEESRTNENDSAVSNAALTIALTEVVPTIDSRKKTI